MNFNINQQNPFNDNNPAIYRYAPQHNKMDELIEINKSLQLQNNELIT